jgi:hypothetical protein
MSICIPGCTVQIGADSAARSTVGGVRTATRVSPPARKVGGVSATSQALPPPEGWGEYRRRRSRGGGLVPTHADWVASALNLESFKPPYLPALGGPAGTFPPFGSASGGTAARCARWASGGTATRAGRNLSPIRLRLWGNRCRSGDRLDDIDQAGDIIRLVVDPEPDPEAVPPVVGDHAAIMQRPVMGMRIGMTEG